MIAYAETGELIHPRFERRERSLNELPELPIAYADPAALLAVEAGEPVLHVADDHGFGDDEPLETAGPGPRRRKSAGRRLASGRRAAK